jgi:transglycosylase-like protein with SLT domain
MRRKKSLLAILIALFSSSTFVIVVLMAALIANSNVFELAKQTLSLGFNALAVPKEFRNTVAATGNLCPEVTPAVVAAQIEQESGWDPTVENKQSGAKGLSQFIPSTWATWGGGAPQTDGHAAIRAQEKYDCYLAGQVRKMQRGEYGECVMVMHEKTYRKAAPKAGEMKGSVFDLMLASYNAGPGAVCYYRGVPDGWSETEGYVPGITALMAKYQTQSTTTTGNTRATDKLLAGKGKNPRTAQQAIAAARIAKGTGGWAAMCDNFVAQAYGWGSSGSYSAGSHWQTLVAAGMAHPKDTNPPPGALLFYSTSTYGHVTIYLGNDMVASNDILVNGLISIVPRREVTNGRWRLPYLGWAAPYFPGAGGTSRIHLTAQA